MSIWMSIAELIEAYGDEIEVLSVYDDTVIFRGRAILQSLGNMTGKLYRYIGNPDIRIDTYSPDILIKASGNKFRVKKSDVIFCGTEKLYISAVLEKQ